MSRHERPNRPAMSPAPVSESPVPGWLEQLMSNPPPVLDPEEVRRNEQRDRAHEANGLLARLPDVVGAVTGKKLVERIRHPKLVEAANHWEPSIGNAAFLGETGIGKTSAAGLICRRVLVHGVRHGGGWWEVARNLHWTRAEQLERAMRSHPNGRGECPAMLEALNASLLVIDDLGWERDKRVLAAVLAARYDSPKLTIVTSGLRIDELRSEHHYGDAVIRRMLTTRGAPAMKVEAFPAWEAANPRPVHNPPHFQERAER